MNSLDKSFKYGDKIECTIWDKKHLLDYFNINYDHNEGDPLNQEEIDEINWLLSNNILNDPFVNAKVIKKINSMYLDNDEEKRKICNDLSEELQITTILFSSKKNKTTQKNDLIIAFGCECECEEEHGISISFKNRNFMNVAYFMDFNYEPSPAEQEFFKDVDNHPEKYGIHKDEPQKDKLSEALDLFKKARLMDKKKCVQDIIKIIDEKKAYTFTEPKKIGNFIEFGYYSYNERLYDIMELIQPDFDYLENFKKIKDKDFATLTMKELETYLTRIFRGERFADGTIASCIEDGTFQRLLERFLELNEQKEFKK